MYYSRLIDRILIEIHKFSFSLHLLVVRIIIIFNRFQSGFCLYMPEILKEHVIPSLLLIYHSYLY